MKAKLSVVGRAFLVLLVAWAGTAGPAWADDNVPPAGAVGSDSGIPVHIIQPSPSQGLGALATAAVDSIDVVQAPTLDMKVLVILDDRIWVQGSGGTWTEEGDGGSQMITAYLDILGIPYDVVNVDHRTSTDSDQITEAMLWDGVNHGHYYAIFLSSSSVWWPAPLSEPPEAVGLLEGLSQTEREAIRRYERNFGVRRVTWYAYPEPSAYGLAPQSATLDDVTVTMTAEGQQVFGYLNPGLSLALTEGYTVLATPAPLPGTAVTPLVVDGAGHAIVAIYTPADAGEHLVVTTSSYYPATPPVSLHARLWPYGIINWATKGVFLGERHLYFTPQPDDVLSHGDRWDPVNHVIVPDDGFRLMPDDLDNLVAWMTAFKGTPNAADFKIEMPFNGEGVLSDLADDGSLDPASLSARSATLQDQFVWLNHTYSHMNLDNATFQQTYTEIISNTEVATQLGFGDYVTTTLLTGEYSGLTNTLAIDAAHSAGIRYLLSNASYPQWASPTPNTGLLPYPDYSDLLFVPRLANNVFYFASTPEQEADYYNFVYCPGYNTNPDTTVPCFTYEELLDATTNQALGFLLDFNVSATMFHMNNLDRYGAGDATLLGDYVESLYGKYNALYNPNVPILSPRTQEIGDKMWQRMDYNASGAAGTILACTHEITLTTTNAATVPVTGITHGGNTEEYAGQPISYIDMAAGATVHVPGTAVSGSSTASPTTPGAVTGLVLVAQADGSRTMSWNPVAGAYGYRIYRGSSAQTLVAIDAISGTYFADAEVTTDTTYAVTAIADDCWKQESTATLASLRPTAVRLTSLDAGAGSALSVASLLVIPLVGLVLVLGRRRQENRS